MDKKGWDSQPFALLKHELVRQPIQKVSKRDNYLNFLILRERDYLKSRTAYNDYVSALLGYYEGLDIEDTHKAIRELPRSGTGC